VEYQSKGKPAAILGVLLEYCSNEGDAARYTIDQAAGFFETVLTQQGVASPEADLRSAFDLIGVETPLSVRETIGSYLDSARILGRRTAELHLALGAEKEEPAFAPEPFGELYQRSLSHGLLAAVNATFENLRENLKTLPEAIRGSVGEVLEREGEIQAIYASLREKRIEAMRLRTHGDYHLGQLLCKGNDFIIIDFEGEPMKSIGERRIKRSPLKDVAGMLRSFHYAWEIALRQLRPPTLPSGAEALSKAREWGRYWEKWISASFLTDYLGIARPGGFLPVDGDQLEILLKSLLLERAIYEISYELNSRTDWLDIPINGLLEILKSDR